MTKPVVYVAGPFRAPNAWEVEQNIRRAEGLALELWKCGCAVICPHANTRLFPTQTAAARAYDKAARKRWGRFAWQNL